MQMRTVGQQQGVSSAVDGRLPLKLQSQVSVIVMSTASMCWPCSAAMRAHQEQEHASQSTCSSAAYRRESSGECGLEQPGCTT